MTLFPFFSETLSIPLQFPWKSGISALRTLTNPSSKVNKTKKVKNKAIELKKCQIS